MIIPVVTSRAVGMAMAIRYIEPAVRGDGCLLGPAEVGDLLERRTGTRVLPRIARALESLPRGDKADDEGASHEQPR
jgi:hypothetical protein